MPASGGRRPPPARSCATRSTSPGPGCSASASFAFADEPGDSVLTVPEVVVGRRGDRTWLTTVTAAALDQHATISLAESPRAPSNVIFADGALNGEQWMTVVADAVARINAGALEKVVLARDLVATTDEPIDVRWPLQRLASGYPMCWTFHVDGLFGATPELLVRRERGLVTSRVLAGTIRRTGDDERDLALAATLARSSKDLEEHEYAVRSVADALDPHCSSMNVPEAPFVLHLPNVMHLATDVAGVVHDAATVSSLQLAEALHPSAAVGGTPTADATVLIAEIEGMDRGRYAGPVGLDGRRRRRRVGHRAALGRGQRRHASGCSPAAASSPTPTRRPSWPSRRPSSSPCATPSPTAEPRRVRPAVLGRARAGAGRRGPPLGGRRASVPSPDPRTRRSGRDRPLRGRRRRAAGRRPGPRRAAARSGRRRSRGRPRSRPGRGWRGCCGGAHRAGEVDRLGGLEPGRRHRRAQHVDRLARAGERVAGVEERPVPPAVTT